MRKLIALIIIGTILSCNKDSEIAKFEILFAPSFLHPTKFTIDTENKTIEQYTFQEKYYRNQRTDLNLIREFIVDTLIVHYKKTFTIEKQDFNSFIKKLKSIKLDSTVKHERTVLDGIGFRYSTITAKNDTISLTSISPDRTKEFQMDYEFLDIFFDFIYKIVKDYEGIATLENIQDYFDYGLPIKKINNNPMEYRIWGSLSGCREDNSDFLEFLDGLPNNKPVIFDLRNGSIAYCLNDVLEEFSKKKNICIYGEDSMSVSKEIMDEIKLAEKNGEVLSELRISAYEMHKEMYEYWKKNKNLQLFETREEIIKTIANNVYN